MNTRIQKLLAIAMLAMAAVLFVLQCRSLFIFPQANSLRWFGDETWLMSEAIQQIATGIVRYPLAIGSTLAQGKGLVLSMTWLSTLLYGLPGWIVGHNVVAVGRIVTSVLAISLLGLIYGCSRSMGASRLASSFVVLLLVSTRSFFFASHSARPDLLAGLIVLAFVTICTKLVREGKDRTARWWFGYGAVILFLSLSSSIHLLTLLGPVSLYFLWRLGGLRSWNYAVSAIVGAVGMVAIMVAVYYFTTGNIALFSVTAGPVQFQDVLSSIPIRRPFSRSVQVANIIIRLKQFVHEAPQVFLLPLLLPVFLRRMSEVSRTLYVALSIVLLSWLLLEGAEINYLMHLLPLLFLALAMGVSAVEARWKNLSLVILCTIAILSFEYDYRDSSEAFASASGIDKSNQAGIKNIEAQIGSSWHGAGKPRVVSEPISLDRLSQDTSIEAMTDHFISFPLRTEPLNEFFQREHVDYVVLYNSPVYPKDRPRDDPFYKVVASSGTLITRYVGMSGDMGRDYFGHSNWQDTLLLFQMHR